MGKKFYKYLLLSFGLFLSICISFCSISLYKYYNLYTDLNSSQKSRIEYSLCKISNEINCYIENKGLPKYLAYINNYFFEKIYKDLSNQKINSKIILELWYEHNLYPELLNSESNVKRTLYKSRKVLFILSNLAYEPNNYFDNSLKFTILKNILTYIEKNLNHIKNNSNTLLDIYEYSLSILHKEHKQNLFLLKNQLFLIYASYLKETKNVDCNLKHINGLKFLTQEIIFEKENIKSIETNELITHEDSLFKESLPIVNQIFRNHCKTDLLN